MPDWGIEFSGKEFIEEVLNYDRNLLNSFDVLAFHPYMYPYPPSLPPEQETPPAQESLEQMIESVKDVLLKFGVQDMPLWITEIGWPTYGEVSEEEQAEYLVRSLLLSLSQNVQIYCWYTTFDGKGNAFPPAEDYFGIIRYSGSVIETKHAYSALKFLFTLAGDFRIDIRASEKISAGFIIHLKNENTKDEVLVLWSPVDEWKMAEVSSPGDGNVIGYDIYGNEIGLDIIDGRIYIPLRESPQYVVIRK
jgi:hypothetical protein